MLKRQRSVLIQLRGRRIQMSRSFLGAVLRIRNSLIVDQGGQSSSLLVPKFVSLRRCPGQRTRRPRRGGPRPDKADAIGLHPRRWFAGRRCGNFRFQTANRRRKRLVPIAGRSGGWRSCIGDRCRSSRSRHRVRVVGGDQTHDGQHGIGIRTCLIGRRRTRNKQALGGFGHRLRHSDRAHDYRTRSGSRLILRRIGISDLLHHRRRRGDRRGSIC